MTTLAIIGGGIAGRTLLFTLAKESSPSQKILFFEAPDFSRPCSLNSTAVVAPRGLSAGHSPLGDLLVESYREFQTFVRAEAPAGVQEIIQYTGATEKLDNFRRRYPMGGLATEAGPLRLSSPTYLAREEAFLIDPAVYLSWLESSAGSVKTVHDFVTAVEPGETVTLRCQSGAVFESDEVVFATGAYSGFWSDLNPTGEIKIARTVQGAYLEFPDIDLNSESFSFTLDGMNLIYRAHSHRLLVGSTSELSSHELPDRKELGRILNELNGRLGLTLKLDDAEVRVGLREKARKREPYLVSHGNIHYIGGYYKNGFSLSLRMARSLVARLRRERA